MDTMFDVAAAIESGKYADADNIYYEDCAYFITAAVLLELPERVWVDTVGGFRLRHGIDAHGK